MSATSASSSEPAGVPTASSHSPQYDRAVGDREPMRVLTWDEWNELARNALPPTPDDVSITSDGRRLDTAEKVIEFFAELEAEREGRSATEA